MLFFVAIALQSGAHMGDTVAETFWSNMEDDIDSLTDLGSQLIGAILEKKSAQYIQQIIDTGAPLWYQEEEEGMSALHAAAYTQNFELVSTLIDQGAIWNASACQMTIDSLYDTHCQHSGQSGEHCCRYCSILQ
jgi:hypothetical protein